MNKGLKKLDIENINGYSFYESETMPIEQGEGSLQKFLWAIDDKNTSRKKHWVPVMWNDVNDKIRKIYLDTGSTFESQLERLKCYAKR